MKVPWYLMAKGKGGGGYKTASGPIVSVNDALVAPLRSLVANIDPVQDLHGYDNPWPAGGGANQWDEEWERGSIDATTGANIDNDQNRIRSANYISVSPNNTYYVVAPLAMQLFWYDSNKVYLERTTGANRTLTPVSGAYFLRFAIGSSSNPIATYGNNIAINYPATVTSYSPYSNICPISGWSAVNVWVKPTYDPTADPTATIQLGQTVYGGTLDVKTGVLTVDRAMVDLGTLNWSKNTAYPGLFNGYSLMPAIKVPTPRHICSIYIATDSTTVISLNNSIAISGGGTTVYAHDDSYETATTFKAAMSGVQLVYELDTPITIPLTPQEISTLQGQNNVWADTGDVTVEYLAAGGANPDLMKLAVAFMGRK